MSVAALGDGKTPPAWAPGSARPTAQPGGGGGRRIFSPVRTSMWAWRERTKAAMLNFASSELPKGKLRRDWKQKAYDFGACGRVVSALACDGCANVNTESGTLIASCGLRICPICARRRAEKLRARLRAAWDAGGREPHHAMYFLTFTLRYDPTDPAEVTAEGLLRRKNALTAAWSSVWRQYLKRRAHAACRAIEVGSSGMVHLHVLYVGRRPDIRELRARWVAHTASPLVNVRYIPDRKAPTAIVELAKYVTKGASPAKVDVLGSTPAGFIDPELAVRVEIAFSGDRLVQCYGAWLGITVDDDEETDEEEAEARDLHARACKRCGLVGEWHCRNYYLDEWFEKFGGELDDWRPRIGGTGPRKREKDPNPPPKEIRDGKQRKSRQRDRRSRRERRSWGAAGNGDPRNRERPAWTTGAPRLGEPGGQVDRQADHGSLVDAGRYQAKEGRPSD